nr:MAG TPA: hypothetical protein [Caudoviricetes sp.]
MADNGIFPPFFTFLFLILTGIMVTNFILLSQCFT